MKELRVKICFGTSRIPFEIALSVPAEASVSAVEAELQELKRADCSSKSDIFSALTRICSQLSWSWELPVPDITIRI